jgi:hypothetical protein
MMQTCPFVGEENSSTVDGGFFFPFIDGGIFFPFIYG